MHVYKGLDWEAEVMHVVKKKKISEDGHASGCAEGEEVPRQFPGLS